MARNIVLLLRAAICAAAAIMLISPAPARASASFTEPGLTAPSEAEVMRLLDLKLQRLKPAEFLYRTLLFDRIAPGEPHDGVYPFVVSITIHDYSAGWPPNRYFGKTCISKMDKSTFTVRLTSWHEWAIEGPVNVAEPLCRNNPAEKVSAFPLGTLPGNRIRKGTPPAEVAAKRPAGVLSSGEYACSTLNGRLAENMGFRLKLDRTYTDLAGKNGGKYVIDAVAATVSFHGGFLDGRKGTDIELMRFAFPEYLCQRW